MRAREALRELAELSASQWGMFTSAQASARGISRLTLSRLTESGDLERLAQGVYKDAGAPGGAYLDVRVAWLSSEPARLASDRLNDGHRGVVVSGQTAAWLHDIGDLRSNRIELSAAARRQTQRADIHYRRRELDPSDVTIREGLPVTTPERTIADLVEDRIDLSLVANTLRDANRTSSLDLELLAAKLAPLAERNGHRKGDGAALRDRLREIAGTDLESLAREIASQGGIGALVTRNFLMHMSEIDFDEALRTVAASMRASVEGLNASVIAEMAAIDWGQIAQQAAALEASKLKAGQ